MIETDSESPAGAGISGSSALMIATTAALARFTDRNLTLEQMRVIAQNVEAQIINVPTGCQDYYPALYGGVSAIHLNADGIHREAVPVALEEIESRFVLAYTGAPRQSGINNWEVFKAHINGDKRVFRNFETNCGDRAYPCTKLSLRANGTEVARLLREEWRLRRTQRSRHHNASDRQAHFRSRKNTGPGRQSLRRGRRRMRDLSGGKGAASRVATAIGDNGGRVLPLQVARDGLRFASWIPSLDAPAELKRAIIRKAGAGVPYEVSRDYRLCFFPYPAHRPSVAGQNPRRASQARSRSKPALELVHIFTAELVYVRAPFPMGSEGLRLQNGVVSPAEELQQARGYGDRPPSPETRLASARSSSRTNYIHIEINGGPVRKAKVVSANQQSDGTMAVCAAWRPRIRMPMPAVHLLTSTLTSMSPK